MWSEMAKFLEKCGKTLEEKTYVLPEKWYEFQAEQEVCEWFEDNYEKLGFSHIIHRQKYGTPDYIMEKNDRKVNVEIEKRARNFKEHEHNPEIVDLVVCVEKDKDLDVKTFEIARVQRATVWPAIRGANPSEGPLTLKELIDFAEENGCPYISKRQNVLYEEDVFQKMEENLENGRFWNTTPNTTPILEKLGWCVSLQYIAILFRVNNPRDPFF